MLSYLYLLILFYTPGQAATPAPATHIHAHTHTRTHTRNVNILFDSLTEKEMRICKATRKPIGLGLFNLIPIVRLDFEDTTYVYLWQTVQSNTFQTTQNTCMYGTPEGTFLFQYLSEKKSKQKELKRKSKQ